jgi:hypothetical protein
VEGADLIVVGVAIWVTSDRNPLDVDPVIVDKDAAHVLVVATELGHRLGARVADAQRNRVRAPVGITKR